MRRDLVRIYEQHIEGQFQRGGSMTVAEQSADRSLRLSVKENDDNVVTY